MNPYGFPEWFLANYAAKTKVVVTGVRVTYGSRRLFQFEWQP